jgi:anti-sigma factor RsiW
MSDLSPNCEWVRERLDGFVDGELDAAERAVITRHCAVCAACTRELEMAIRVRRMLRTLPAFEAPAHVVDAAEQRALASNVVPLRARRARVFRLGAAVAAAAVIVASMWFGVERRAAHDVSDAEVRRAAAEVALAFRYVDRYSDGVVRDEVLEKRVMPRIERAVSRDATSRDSAKTHPPDRT